MESIFEIVTAQSIASYWNNIPNAEPPYMGEEIFPAKKQLGTELSFIKGANGVPIELKASTLDAKVMIRDRRGFNEIKTKLPFFKEAVYIDEELRQKLNIVLATGNQTYIDAILNKVFEDEIGLIKGAKVVAERMRMQLLSTGRIYVNNNGTAYEYDYSLGEDQKYQVTNLWSNAETSNPIEDLNKAVIDAQLRTGVKPARAIMTTATFNLLCQSKSIREAIYVTNNGGIVTNEMVRELVSMLTGLSIGLNDSVYAQAGSDGATGTKFFPDNVVTLIPAGKLGNTVYGTTPEESDLMSNPNVANVSIVDTGVAITTTKETDPVNVKTKVSEMVMPSFEEADKVVILTVAE